MRSVRGDTGACSNGIFLKITMNGLTNILEKRSAIYTALMPLSTLILTYNSDLEEMLFPRPQQYLHVINILDS